MSGMDPVYRKSLLASPVALSLSLPLTVQRSDQQVMINDIVQSIFMARNSVNLSVQTKLDKIRRERVKPSSQISE